MSRKATEFQKKEMSKMYRGKEIFKPLNTGWIDEHVACVREWVANIFFYRKGGKTIMIDAGYNYDRLEEKMGWLGIDPKSIQDILITHQDTDHVGAVEADSPGLFRQARLYVGEIENRYLTGEVRRKVIYHLYKLPQVTINNEKVLLKDEQVFHIGEIEIRCFHVPGHTWGHMVYLIDGKYLFTGDTIWFGADGGYSFISTLAEDKDTYLTRPDLGRLLSEESLRELKRRYADAPQVVIVLSDGLSTDALLANYEEILPPLLNGLKQAGIRAGAPLFLRHGRVKAEDRIGEAVGCDVVVMLVGERPGLGQSESMSCYAVYRPTADTLESDRSVLSNIHREGTPPVEAAAVIVDLVRDMLHWKASGIKLNRRQAGDAGA